MNGAPDRDRPFWYLRRSRKSAASEIDEELAFHFEKRIEELRASGLPLELARDEARRQFGDVETTRRYCRRQAADKETRMRLGFIAAELGQDLRITCRSLLRSPVALPPRSKARCTR